MSTSTHILAIDLGTSGPKVALVADDGRLVSRAVRPVRTRQLPGNGAEQDPDEIWSAVVEAAREALHAAEVPPDTVRGVICDSHYFSLVPVDASGHATMPCIPWLDQRGAPHVQAIYDRGPEAFLRWLEVHGLPSLPTGNDSLAHMLWIREACPEVYERTHAFVEPMDYVNARLTGHVCANARTAFPLVLTDNRDLSNVQYDDELVRLTGVDREKLPPLVPPGERVGKLLPDVAETLGLSPSTEVFSGLNDTQAVAVGAGTFLPGRGGVNVGTTTQLLAHLDGMRSDLERSILSMPSGLPDRYMVLGENGLGGKLLEHFVLNVVHSTDAFADHSTEDAYAQLEQVIAAEPPGSGGLLFLPWLGGVQAPVTDPHMRGAFLNFSFDTTRTRMMRAIVEGIAFNMRWLLPAVEEVHGHAFEELRFSGGGAVSDTWSQVMADVFGRPVLQVADPRYLNAKGAAFVALVQAGLSDLDRIDGFCPTRRAYEPDPARSDLYARLFEQFVKAYEQNRPICETLNSDPALAALRAEAASS